MQRIFFRKKVFSVQENAAYKITRNSGCRDVRWGVHAKSRAGNKRRNKKSSHRPPPTAMATTTDVFPLIFSQYDGNFHPDDRAKTQSTVRTLGQNVTPIVDTRSRCIVDRVQRAHIPYGPKDNIKFEA